MRTRDGKEYDKPSAQAPEGDVGDEAGVCVNGGDVLEDDDHPRLLRHLQELLYKAGAVQMRDGRAARPRNSSHYCSVESRMAQILRFDASTLR